MGQFKRILHALGGAAASRFVDGLQADLRGGCWQQVTETLADALFGLYRQEAAIGHMQAVDGALVIDFEKQVGQRGKGGLQMLLGGNDLGLGTFLPADVDHYPAQPAWLVVFTDHGDHIMQPDHSPILADEAVFEVVGLLAGRVAGAVVGSPLTILRVYVRHPETGLQPFTAGIAQQALGLLADEGDLEGARVGFPDDAVHGVEQVAKALFGGPDGGFDRLAQGDFVLQLGNHVQGQGIECA